MRQFDPNDKGSEACDDYLADMAIARRACECRECGSLYHNEPGAILCYIAHTVRWSGDLESSDEDHDRVLWDTHYHLTRAVNGIASDLDEAEPHQRRAAKALLQQLNDILEAP